MISLFSPRMKNNELWSWRLISSSFSSDHLRFRCYMKQMTVEQLDWDWTCTSYFLYFFIVLCCTSAGRTPCLMSRSRVQREREPGWWALILMPERKKDLSPAERVTWYLLHRTSQRWRGPRTLCSRCCMWNRRPVLAHGSARLGDSG